MEDRIESSHFSPPLSKQRIEYARTMINAVEAKTLVDLGCGSGSLLEALLREPTTLEHMIGIDISRKALIRGAKTLSATLTKPVQLTVSYREMIACDIADCYDNAEWFHFNYVGIKERPKDKWYCNDCAAVMKWWHPKVSMGEKIGHINTKKNHSEPQFS